MSPDLVRSARLVVDHIDAAVRQAGPIVQALEAGTIGRERLESIGNVMLRSERPDAQQSRLTYYNSVGVGIQDAAVLELILARAASSGVGKTWEL